MKKIIIAFLLSVATVCSVGCGNAAANNDSVVNTAETETVAVETASVAEQTVTTTSEEAQTVVYEQMPAEAMPAFESMSVVAKNVYPLQKGDRSYGYLGEDSVNDEDCYKFVVIDNTKKQTTQVAEICVCKNTDSMYVYNNDNDSYDELVAEESDAVWADTTTESFVSYLSTDSESSDSVLSESSSNDTGMTSQSTNVISEASSSAN